MNGEIKMNKKQSAYWYHYDNRGNMNNDYPYNQYDNEEEEKIKEENEKKESN